MANGLISKHSSPLSHSACGFRRGRATIAASVFLIAAVMGPLVALVTYAWNRTKRENQVEQRLEQAASNLHRAQQELHAIFLQRLVVPSLGKEQACWADPDLLRRGIAYYQNFIQENRDRGGSEQAVLEAYHWLGTLLDIDGQFNEAGVAYSNESAFIAMLLASGSPDEQAEHELFSQQLTAHFKAATSLYRAGRRNEAVELLEALRWKIEASATEFPNRSNRQSLAAVFYEMAILKALMGAVEAAEQAGLRSHDIAASLCADHPEVIDYQVMRIAACVLRRRVLSQSGRLDELRTIYDEMLVAVDALCTHNRVQYEPHLRDLASRAIELQQYDDAELFYQRALPTLERTGARGKDRASYHSSTAGIYHGLGEVALLQKEPTKARELFAKAVFHQTAACRLAPRESAFWSSLAAHYRGMGEAYYREGDAEAAVTSLKKTLEMRQGPDPMTWLLLAMGSWRKGDAQQACFWYGRALREMPRPALNSSAALLQREAADLLKCQVRSATGPDRAASHTKSFNRDPKKPLSTGIHVE